MYEMVMLVAMTASVETPAFFKRRNRGGCSGVIYSGCSGYGYGYSGCSGYVPTYSNCCTPGTVIYSAHGTCSGTIISIVPIESGKGNNGKDTKPDPKKLSAEEQKMLDYILSTLKSDKDKAAAKAEFLADDAAGRKKYYDEVKKANTKPEPKKLSAEEQKMLDYILSTLKSDKDKAAAKAEFMGLDAKGRKGYHDEVKKANTKPEPKKLSAEEQKMLDFILSKVKTAKEKDEAKAEFMGLDAKGRKDYYDEVKNNKE